MAGNPGDSAIAAGPTNPSALDQQLELSRSVQSMAQHHFQPAAAAHTRAGSEAQQAAPDSTIAKAATVTVEGVENLPGGMWHALHDGKTLGENAVISVALGLGARYILPETGAAGKLFAFGLGAYFAEQAAVPAFQAYKTGLNARTMGDLHGAGRQLGDALGGLAVNAPIGILGYKLGGGVGKALMRAPEGAEVGTGAATKPGPGKLEGRVEVTEKPEVRDTGTGLQPPKLPDRYLPITENFSGQTVPGISREFLNNLQVDNTGNYYGAGLRYPDIMADPEMAQYINGHNQYTLSRIGQEAIDHENANEAKALSYKLPTDWDGLQPPQNAIDVTDGGDGTMRVGGKTYTLTDDGAPNRKLTVSEGFGGSKTLIAEPKDFEIQQVIQSSVNGADHFAVVGSQDGASILHIYDANGKLISNDPLPGFGTLHDVRQGTSPSEVRFLYDTPVSHPQMVTVDMASGKATFSPLSSDVFDTDKYMTEKIMVPWTDVDGKAQTVPAFVGRPKNMAFDGSAISQYKIYGGFDVGPQYLGYSPSTASVLMDGGISVDPVLPGDGGLGSGNFEEGTGKEMQNTKLALAAIITKLHDLGYTSPEKTGIYGRSNGGKVVNSMLNDYPHLIGAAVSESGVNSIFDSPVINVDAGSSWTPNFGDPSDPSQVGWMAKQDPLNNLSKDKQYPATMIEIGTVDGVVNAGNGITLHNIRSGMGNGEILLYSRIGEGHDPVNLNLSLQTAFLRSRLLQAKV